MFGGKRWLAAAVLLCACMGGAMAQEGFEIKYKVVPGKELAKLIGIPANWNDDHCYVVGSIRNLGKKNALVAVVFWHNKNRYFTTSGYREIGWVDGNDSAARMFLFPIGLRNEAPPTPPDDLSFRIKVLQVK